MKRQVCQIFNVVLVKAILFAAAVSALPLKKEADLEQNVGVKNTYCYVIG